MAGRLDEATDAEQPAVVEQHEAFAQMDARQRHPPGRSLGRGHQCLGNAAAAPGWRHRQPCQIEPIILLSP
jgi:hypothetical protein